MTISLVASALPNIQTHTTRSVAGLHTQHGQLDKKIRLNHFHHLRSEKEHMPSILVNDLLKSVRLRNRSATMYGERLRYTELKSDGFPVRNREK